MTISTGPRFRQRRRLGERHVQICFHPGTHRGLVDAVADLDRVGIVEIREANPLEQTLEVDATHVRKQVGNRKTLEFLRNELVGELVHRQPHAEAVEQIADRLARVVQGGYLIGRAIH